MDAHLRALPTAEQWEWDVVHLVKVIPTVLGFVTWGTLCPFCRSVFIRELPELKGDGNTLG